MNYFKNIEYLKSNWVTGLHCVVDGGNEPLFTSVILHRKNGKIGIELQSEFKCEFDRLSEKIPVKYPVCISIEGKGILHRRVEKDLTKPIIQQAIPNANESDFLFEQFEGTENSSFISFARKEFVEDILNRLKDQKFSVIGLTVSPFCVIGIYDFFPDLPSVLKTGSYEIVSEKKDLTIIDFRKTDPLNEGVKYSPGGNEIASSIILPFYHGLTYYTNKTTGPEYSVITDQKNEYSSKRAFMFAGWAILSLIFIILLANLFVFTSLSDEKQKLELQVSGNIDLITRLKHVKEELVWKEKFSGQAGGDHKKWFSYLADQTGASVTEEITLEKLDFHPVSSKITNFKEIELQTDIIRIEGITKSSQAVNEWALTLKKMAGITNVVVVSYSQLENPAYGAFTIEITLANSNN